VTKLTAADGVGSDLFGDAVAISSDTVVVGLGETMTRGAKPVRLTSSAATRAAPTTGAR